MLRQSSDAQYEAHNSINSTSDIGRPSHPTPSLPSGFKRTEPRSLCAGMLDDLRVRWPWYRTDWTDGLNRHVMAASLFMFFASISPELPFGVTLASATDGALGLQQVLLSAGLGGMVYAVLAGQPITIVGVTAPTVAFYITIYQFSKSLEFDFADMCTWMCIWCGIFHMLIAVFNGTKYVSWVTRFPCEIFGMFIAINYIYMAVQDLICAFQNPLPGEVAGDAAYYNYAPSQWRACKGLRYKAPGAGGRVAYLYSLSAAVFSLLLCAGCCISLGAFVEARKWSVLTPGIRDFLAQYCTPLLTVAWTLIRYVPQLEEAQVQLATVPAPEERGIAAAFGSANVDFVHAEGRTIGLAIIPAMLLTILFFFDHNVSSLMAQKPEYRLRKGTAYNWDFFMLGVIVIVSGILGIPPPNGLIPQAPMHAYACAVFKIESDPATGSKKEVLQKVYENRVSPFMQSAGMFFCLQAFGLIQWIPVAVLDGLFLHFAFMSFPGNEFAGRLRCLFMTHASRRDEYPQFEGVHRPRVVLYTLVQVISLVIILVVQFSKRIAPLFPLFIFFLVPLRRYGLPRLFTERELELLDGSEIEALENSAESDATATPDADSAGDVTGSRAEVLPTSLAFDLTRDVMHDDARRRAGRSHVASTADLLRSEIIRQQSDVRAATLGAERRRSLLHSVVHIRQQTLNQRESQTSPLHQSLSPMQGVDRSSDAHDAVKRSQSSAAALAEHSTLNHVALC